MEIKRLFDVPLYQLEKFSTKKSINIKKENKWKSYSTQEIINQANKLSAGLIKKGIKKGDKIAIISFNCPEWIFTDIAIGQIGAISVPLYPNITAKDYKNIITESETKLIFAGNEELFNKVTKAIINIPKCPQIYTFEKVEKAKNWQKLQIEYLSEAKEIEKRKKEVKPDNLATIIYTSGTTGFPKGVMLTHRNILSNSKSVAQRFSLIKAGYRAISFLPLCHIFERTASYTHMLLGVEIYFTSIEDISQTLKEIKPHYFATVPRLLEKAYDKIIKKGNNLKGIKKNLFFWALQLGKKFDPNKNLGWWYNKKLAIANKLIFSKWREAFGGNIIFILSGAAALQPRLARVFWAAKITLLEAYGLTETSPCISLSKVEKGGYRISCVGPLLKDVKVRIAKDGEIQVSGPGIMQGYYKKPKQTAEVLNKGWFSTGDIGEYKEGFLKITDRKKEMFKTSGGKYIAPQQMENKFKESIYIEQIMVVGECQKHPSALIIPNQESVSDWCKKHNIFCTTIQEKLKNQKLRAKIDREIQYYNQKFAKYERIKKYKLISKMWTIEEGELTPTLKLKRKNILKAHKTEIENFYKEE